MQEVVEHVISEEDSFDTTFQPMVFICYLFSFSRLLLL